MEFLKDILGDKYQEVATAITTYNETNKDKPIKLANLGEGKYVDKSKYLEAETKLSTYEIAARKQKEIEEADKLKNMSAEQQQAEEVKRMKEEFAAMKREKLTAEYKTQLVRNGLPDSIADLIPVNEADKAKLAIDGLTEFKSSIETPLKAQIAELQEKLKNADMRGTPPKAAATPTGGTTKLKTIY